MSAHDSPFAPASSNPGAASQPGQVEPLESAPERPEPLYDPYWVGPVGGAGGGEGPQAAPVAPPSTRSRRGQRVTFALALSGLLVALGTVGALGYGVYHFGHLLDRDRVASDAEEDTTKRAGLESAADDEQVDTGAPSPEMRRETEVELRGKVEVVDIGLDAKRLEVELAGHDALAREVNKKLLVMTVAKGCEPCAGLDDALSDPRMQEALEHVRLVRVDLEAFGDELKALHMPTNVYPAFFVLGPDMRPIDAIHGGEWGEDIAQNIAPVLGPFVRGEYRRRQHPDWLPTTTSIPL